MKQIQSTSIWVFFSTFVRFLKLTVTSSEPSGLSNPLGQRSRIIPHPPYCEYPPTGVPAYLPPLRSIVLSGQSSAGVRPKPGRGCWWADQISATRSSTSQLTIITILPWLEIEIWYYGILWYCGRKYLWIGTYINTWMSHKNNISLAGMHMGVSENSVPLNPMVNDHYPY